jgi:hypothetical protein
MAQSIVEVQKTFRITKNGVEVILSEDEMRSVIRTREVRDLIALELGSPSATKKDVQYKFADDGHLKHGQEGKATFPPGFKEIGQMPCDPKGPYKSTFAYAFNETTGEYGYKILGSDGKVSSFHKLGKENDPTSLLGGFLRAIENIQKPMIKREFFSLNIPNVSEGRRMKSLLDVAEIAGYLIRQPLPERDNRIGYRRSTKRVG